MRGDEPGEADDVDGPHVVVFQTFPDHCETQSLPIMHVALGRVIAQDAIDHDLLLVLVEPPVFAAKFAGSLRRRRRKIEPGSDADEAGEHAFKGKEPALEVELEICVRERKGGREEGLRDEEAEI